MISYVIPVYNEVKSIKQLYEEIIEYTHKLTDQHYEIIFVDDGSTDNSYKIMKEISQLDNNVKIIKFRRNFGKSAGLQHGFEAARGEYIFTLDSDLQDNPVEIPRFLNKIQEGYDLVVGWKENRQDPVSKTLPSKVFNFFTTKSFQLKLHDYNCGFKLFRRELVKELNIYGEMHRYIPAIANAKGFKVTEIPVHHRKREFGKSKFGLERYLRGFLDLLTVKLVTQYVKSPLYLFGGIGTILSSIGVLIGIYLTILKYGFGHSLSNRPLLFLTILLIILGLQFFSIGLLGELIVNQMHSRKKRKLVSIEEKINF